MPRITAVIHTRNDAPRLGRALESLRPCDEVIVIDHGSTDGSARVAREHGATVRAQDPDIEPAAHLAAARHDWILCLQANESLTEALEGALFEWKHEEPAADIVGYRLQVRCETSGGGQALAPELRLVHRGRLHWAGELPPHLPDAPQLAGDLLRFEHP